MRTRLNRGISINGKQAWSILAASIVAYEIACSEDQLLSVVVDGWLETHPILTRFLVAEVSLHLLNLLPWYLDLLSMTFWDRVIPQACRTRKA